MDNLNSNNTTSTTFLCINCNGTVIGKHLIRYSRLKCTICNTLQYCCKECGKAFLSRNGVYRHSQEEHEKNTYDCPHIACNAKFNSLYAIAQHCKKIHLNYVKIKNCKCKNTNKFYKSYCLQVFVHGHYTCLSYIGLKISSMQNKLSCPFQCSSSKFKNIITVRNHVKIFHQNSQIVRCKCNIPGKYLHDYCCQVKKGQGFVCIAKVTSEKTTVSTFNDCNKVRYKSIKCSKHSANSKELKEILSNCRIPSSSLETRFNEFEVSQSITQHLDTKQQMPVLPAFNTEANYENVPDVFSSSTKKVNSNFHTRAKIQDVPVIQFLNDKIIHCQKCVCRQCLRLNHEQLDTRKLCELCKKTSNKFNWKVQHVSCRRLYRRKQFILDSIPITQNSVKECNEGKDTHDEIDLNEIHSEISISIDLEAMKKDEEKPKTLFITDKKQYAINSSYDWESLDYNYPDYDWCRTVKKK